MLYLTLLTGLCLATLVGRISFALVFGVLIIWLILIPAPKIHPAGQATVWWKNVRLWAVAIAASQMLLYILWR